MNYLEIRAVVPGIRVFLVGTDPATETAVSITVYSGHIVLAHNTGFRGVVRAGELQPISFYLPDGGLARTPAAMGIELSVRRFVSISAVSKLELGVSDEQVAVAPDPQGGGHWLYVTFRTPILSHGILELNYRVTVQTPKS
jgi:hypothetical protein